MEKDKTGNVIMKLKSNGALMWYIVSLFIIAVKEMISMFVLYTNFLSQQHNL